MYLLIFALGIIIGSFLNVCIYRIPREESVSFPPSHCTHCSHPLAWYDLIPILSFLLLGGKCRYCSGKISSQYPIVELLNGILYIFTYHYFGLNLTFAFFSLVGSVLIIICFIDYYRQIIPDELVLFIFIVSIIYKAAQYFMAKTPVAFMDSIYGFLAGGLLFLIIAVVSNGAMGGGDIKLIAVLGLILGLKNTVLCILLSFVIGATVSIYLLISGRKGRKDAIPFGPFIVVSFLITLFYGDRIIYWYIQKLIN